MSRTQVDGVRGDRMRKMEDEEARACVPFLPSPLKLWYCILAATQLVYSQQSC